MTDRSIFTERAVIPRPDDLANGLGKSYDLWQMIVTYIHTQYAAAMDEWNYPGEKYGWSFRIKDKKRVIAYLLPRDRFFKVALVFGKKATDLVLESAISVDIKKELSAAKVYAEGRGIRIDVKQKKILRDIEMLIDIKLQN